MLTAFVFGLDYAFSKLVVRVFSSG